MKLLKNFLQLMKVLPLRFFSLMTEEMSNLYTTHPNNFNNEVKLHLLSLCFKSYFFKGIFYSNNKIVTNYYLNEFTSDSREKFVNDLLLKINRTETTLSVLLIIFYLYHLFSANIL